MIDYILKAIQYIFLACLASFFILAVFLSVYFLCLGDIPTSLFWFYSWSNWLVPMFNYEVYVCMFLFPLCSLLANNNYAQDRMFKYLCLIYFLIFNPLTILLMFSIFGINFMSISVVFLLTNIFYQFNPSLRYVLSPLRNIIFIITDLTGVELNEKYLFSFAISCCLAVLLIPTIMAQEVYFIGATVFFDSCLSLATLNGLSSYCLNSIDYYLSDLFQFNFSWEKVFQKFTKACEQFPFIEDNPEFGFIAYLNAKYNLKIAPIMGSLPQNPQLCYDVNDYNTNLSEVKLTRVSFKQLSSSGWVSFFENIYCRFFGFNGSDLPISLFLPFEKNNHQIKYMQCYINIDDPTVVSWVSKPGYQSVLLKMEYEQIAENVELNLSPTTFIESNEFVRRHRQTNGKHPFTQGQFSSAPLTEKQISYIEGCWNEYIDRVKLWSELVEILSNETEHQILEVFSRLGYVLILEDIGDKRASFPQIPVYSKFNNQNIICDNTNNLTSFAVKDTLHFQSNFGGLVPKDVIQDVKKHVESSHSNLEYETPTNCIIA